MVCTAGNSLKGVIPGLRCFTILAGYIEMTSWSSVTVVQCSCSRFLPPVYLAPLLLPIYSQIAASSPAGKGFLYLVIRVMHSLPVVTGSDSRSISYISSRMPVVRVRKFNGQCWCPPVVTSVLCSPLVPSVAGVT